MTAALLYPLLTTAAYYLLARAQISKFIWSRYPARLDRFMSCASCTGFWYGLALSATLGRELELPLMSIPADSPYLPFVVGSCAIIWTPIVSWLHLAALERLTVPEVEEATNPEESNGPEA